MTPLHPGAAATTAAAPDARIPLYPPEQSGDVDGLIALLAAIALEQAMLQSAQQPAEHEKAA